jgi:hypothetical protein
LASLRHSLTASLSPLHHPSPENTDSDHAQNWIDFDAGWTDGEWHHVAVTWDFDDGTTKLYFDGVQKTPFWKSRWGGWFFGRGGCLREGGGGGRAARGTGHVGAEGGVA